MRGRWLGLPVWWWGCVGIAGCLDLLVRAQFGSPFFQDCAALGAFWFSAIAAIGVGVAFFSWLWRKFHGVKVFIEYADDRTRPDQPWLRWYHVRARARPGFLPMNPQVTVFSTGSGRHRPWMFEGREKPNVLTTAGSEIPLVAMNLDPETQHDIAGYPYPPRIWRATPIAQGIPNNGVVIAEGENCRFLVRAHWVEGINWGGQQDGLFVLSFKNGVPDFRQLPIQNRVHRAIRWLLRRPAP